MKPLFHPQLVNGILGDPVLFVDFLFERRALLFDIGNIRALPARKLLRLSHLFISHAHMDHFMDLDHLLRIRLGRDWPLHITGPAGITEQIGHKLSAYTWNLVQEYESDFQITVTEFTSDGALPQSRFRCRNGFQREPLPPRPRVDDVLLDEPLFRVRATTLDHGIPCLAFALEEKQHLNVWKTELDALGLPTGPWLNELKSAVRAGAPDEAPFTVAWHDSDGPQQRQFTLGALRDRILRIAQGQKIAYVVDVAGHDDNAARIAGLAQGADVLFIETPFRQCDAERAQRTRHLTAQRAGEIARRAGAKRVEPMHLSPRYGDDPGAVVSEALAAFRGT
jgi:ribonuclease Z